MSETSAVLGLPLLQSAQAQKEVTHNEALKRLERWTFPHVESRSLSTPPADPDAGAAFLVAGGGNGAWAGQDGRIAEWNGGAWTFFDPPEGMLLLISDEGVLLARQGGDWATGLPVEGLRVGGRLMLAGAPSAVPDPSGGSVVDAEARGALAALLAELRTLGLVAASP